ncbi:MAG: hypothetical protein ABJF01_07760 [bacterium]
MTRFPRHLYRSHARPLLAGVLVLLGGRGIAAQDPDPFSRLDGTARYNIELMIDSANAAGLPSQCLRSTALLGLSRKADGKRIVAVVQKQLNLLRVAKSALGGSDREELCGAAAVLDAGGKPGQLNAFRIKQKGRNDLEAFTVWADLIQRGVPSDDASMAITKLWQDGADDATFQSLFRNVQSDILQGLNPGTALQNRIREGPGRVPPSTVKPPEGQQENQSSR